MAIIGNIHDLSRFKFNNHLKKVYEYLVKSVDPSSDVYKRIKSLPIGAFSKFNITSDIFALEQVFITKNRKNCFFESHKKYIDFQLIVEGEELMELVDISNLDIKVKYNSKTDFIIYFNQEKSHTSKILMKNNNLSIYFPNDGHMGLSKNIKMSKVYKTVVKLPLELWNT